MSLTDRNGVTWSFSPDSKKWAAQIGESSTSSASHETLRAKVAGALKKANAAKKEAQPDTRTVTLARIADGMKFGLVDMLVMWDGNEYAPQKYRAYEKNRDGAYAAAGSWKNVGLIAMRLINPDDIDGESLKAIREGFEITKARHTIKETETALKTAIYPTLENLTAQYVPATGEILTNPNPDQRWHHHSYGIPQGVPVISESSSKGWDGWGDEDGWMRKGQARLRLEEVRYGGGVEFAVQMESIEEAGTWDEIYRGDDAERVIWIANALSEIRQKTESAGAWDGLMATSYRGGNELQADSPWPKEVQIIGAFVTPSKLDTREASISTVMRDRPSKDPDDAADSVFSIERAAYYSSRNLFFAKNDVLAEAMNGVDALNRIGEDAFGRGFASFVSDGVRVTTSNSHAIRTRLEQMDDGDDQTPAEIMAKLRGAIRNILADAEKSPVLAQIREDAQSLLSATSRPRPARTLGKK